jgi:ankyrin repeat protein
VQHMAEAAAPAQQPALWLAARWGRTQEVRQRLLGGANIEERSGHLIASTPLQVAVRGGHTDVVQVLLEHGADVSADCCNRYTPLHVAAIYGHAELVMLLFQHGADVSATDANECTPLHWAACRGHAEVVRVLIEHRANIVAEDNAARTPEDVATHFGHPEVVAMLQEAAVTRAKCVAFAMGHHKRLGVGSLVAPLDAEVVRMVLDLVV